MGKVLHIDWQQPEPSEGDTDNHYKEQGWQNTPSTSFIEINNRELSLLKFRKNDCRNQVSADYEEYIYAYEAAAKRLKASVEQYDWQHSKRPKSVYLSSVVHSLQCVLGLACVSPLAKLGHLPSCSGGVECKLSKDYIFR